jgi:hypothetical protein
MGPPPSYLLALDHAPYRLDASIGTQGNNSRFEWYIGRGRERRAIQGLKHYIIIIIGLAMKQEVRIY